MIRKKSPVSGQECHQAESSGLMKPQPAVGLQAGCAQQLADQGAVTGPAPAGKTGTDFGGKK